MIEYMPVWKNVWMNVGTNDIDKQYLALELKMVKLRNQLDMKQICTCPWRNRRRNSRRKWWREEEWGRAAAVDNAKWAYRFCRSDWRWVGRRNSGEPPSTPPVEDKRKIISNEVRNQEKIKEEAVEKEEAEEDAEDEEQAEQGNHCQPRNHCQGPYGVKRGKFCDLIAAT